MSVANSSSTQPRNGRPQQRELVLKYSSACEEQRNILSAHRHCMNPPPKWKRLERLVAAIHHAESGGAVVKWNDKIAGRQFDVTVRFKYGLHDYLTVIECKDYAGKVTVEKVDALVTKARDVKANKAIMVAAGGYQSGCREVADRHGIKLLTLTETTDADLQYLVKEVVPMLNVRSVKFDLIGGGEFELEDVGGRLAYLMRNTKIWESGAVITPDQCVARIQATHIFLSTPRREYRATFSSVARVVIPCEEPFEAVAMRFIAEIVDGIIPNRPVMDSHVMEAFSKKVELRDIEGALEHATSLSRLNMGFDSAIEPGKFYTSVNLGFNYYCSSVKSGVVTWFLVESYQHGMLIQAEMTQRLDNCSGYVEIGDSKILRRLKQMLLHLEKKPA